MIYLGMDGEIQLALPLRRSFRRRYRWRAAAPHNDGVDLIDLTD